ncbi:SubName: Full=Uncharacterized protein {ECO:0000313/EMBL:CCA74871.1} [Serendipita indica DSM 11827]|uniref:Uncharacterized protein n=1 Tax=Serendipita indica (strain DSM 11827) TaxID=1109443 RepID=G4TU78_SERID|nr:SubName: Full=Uncharacterized protein {ECO:0000313/EMBL:CCA74871.1} [Serendipita indica DSM 11827]CCA74871.1 hypothetical protein PIIN_08841 [Serendipita indica DSM 11827]
MLPLIPYPTKYTRDAPLRLQNHGFLHTVHGVHSTVTSLLAPSTRLCGEACGSDRYTATPEALTGPIALRACVKEWERGAKADERSRVHLEVLENGKIYPPNWQGAPKLNWCLYQRHSPWFNEQRCNALYPEVWTITYWTHSW